MSVTDILLISIVEDDTEGVQMAILITVLTGRDLVFSNCWSDTIPKTTRAIMTSPITRKLLASFSKILLFSQFQMYSSRVTVAEVL